MIKVPRPPTPAPREVPPPWIDLAQAVLWIMHRDIAILENIEVWSEGRSGDDDYQSSVDSADLAKSELEAGRLTAWGKLENGYIQIPAVEWLDRIVSKFAGPLGCKPYEAIRVRSEKVVALWPPIARPPRQSQSARPGRPREIDRAWLEQRARAIKLAQPDISLGSLALSITKELPPNKSGKERDGRGIERILKEILGGE